MSDFLTQKMIQQLALALIKTKNCHQKDADFFINAEPMVTLKG